ncbi:SDR family oxidoreductase [Clostridium thailandense]|uniref:SDR family oxidoreductase n=1 Tax=Clostridium thailandense TaxID=2794346 RepID=UPI00398A4A55
MKLKDKVALVTGASAGMGRAIALKYAEDGAKVVAVARRENLLQELAEQAKSLPGEIAIFKGDLAQDDVINKMIDIAIDKFGKLDILVNNAGIMDDFSPVEDVSDELWNNVMDINLNVPFKVLRKAVPVIAKNENGGSIIIVSSIGGLRGGTAGAAYITSKHGVIGLMKAVAYTSLDKKIRCNAICPGAVNTDIGNSMQRLYPEGMHPVGSALSFKGMNMSARSGAPEEIASLAVFLGSDDASFITGAAIVADGGWCAY